MEPQTLPSIKRRRTKYELHEMLWKSSEDDTFCRYCGAILYAEQWWFTVYNSESMQYYKCCSSRCMRMKGDKATSAS